MTQDALTKTAAEIKPSGFLDYRVYLGSLYSSLKQRLITEGEGFSYLLFADLLGFGATTAMHQIVHGYRPLTRKAAVKVVKALRLTGLERRYFLALVDHGNAKSSATREALFEKLVNLKEQALPDESDKATLAYFSEWYHPVIRELVGTPGFRNDPVWIAGHIVPRIRPEQVRASLALQEKLGLIAFDAERQTYVQTKARISTGHRVKGMALTRYHQQMIEHGREALTRIDGKRRDISALTVNVDEATAQRLKSMIHAFQLQLLDEAERAGAGDEVIQINIQLFPFTE